MLSISALPMAGEGTKASVKVFAQTKSTAVCERINKQSDKLAQSLLFYFAEAITAVSSVLDV
jgi:hypothetical protein